MDLLCKSPVFRISIPGDHSKANLLQEFFNTFLRVTAIHSTKKTTSFPGELCVTRKPWSQALIPMVTWGLDTRYTQFLSSRQRLLGSYLVSLPMARNDEAQPGLTPTESPAVPINGSSPSWHSRHV